MPTPKRSSFSLQFVQGQKILGHSFTRRAFLFFWRLPVYSIFPHRQSRQRMVNYLLMININTICKRWIYLCCLLIFILCKDKIETWLVPPVSRYNLGINLINFWHSLAKLTPKCFFIDAAIKIAVLVSWCATLVSLW